MRHAGDRRRTTRPALAAAGLCLLLGGLLCGCAPRVNDRAREFNEDGVYLFQRGDFRGAREPFEVALELPERAASMYQRALAEDPRQPHVVDRLNQLRAKKVGRPLPD